MSLMNDEIPLFHGDNLYRLFLQALKNEVAGMNVMPDYARRNPDWGNLDPHLQIAWGTLGRHLTREVLASLGNQSRPGMATMKDVGHCTRESGHEGPCNGWPKVGCLMPGKDK